MIDFPLLGISGLPNDQTVIPSICQTLYLLCYQLSKYHSDICLEIPNICDLQELLPRLFRSPEPYANLFAVRVVFEINRLRFNTSLANAPINATADIEMCVFLTQFLAKGDNFMDCEALEALYCNMDRMEKPDLMHCIVRANIRQVTDLVLTKCPESNVDLRDVRMKAKKLVEIVERGNAITTKEIAKEAHSTCGRHRPEMRRRRDEEPPRRLRSQPQMQRSERVTRSISQIRRDDPREEQRHFSESPTRRSLSHGRDMRHRQSNQEDSAPEDDRQPIHLEEHQIVSRSEVLRRDLEKNQIRYQVGRIVNMLSNRDKTMIKEELRNHVFLEYNHGGKIFTEIAKHVAAFLNSAESGQILIGFRNAPQAKDIFEVKGCFQSKKDRDHFKQSKCC